MLKRLTLGLLILGCLSLLGCRQPESSAPPASPSVWRQPDTGPGSAQYPHAGYAFYEAGIFGGNYRLYTPSQPVPQRAPVIVLCKGWGGGPEDYSAWMVHLARRGNIVICPRWQRARMDFNGRQFLPRAVRAVRRALEHLSQKGPVQPDLTHFALFGHSTGATIAADMAATWQQLGLPHPRALYCIAPGGFSAATGLQVPCDVAVEDFSRIPGDVLLVCLVGEDDTLVGSTLADRIYQEASAIPAYNKAYLIVHSDQRGSLSLVADHKLCLGSVADGSRVDALDYYAVWKIGDGLTDAAFYGRNRQYALGNTPEQRFMGLWPDGVPIRELTVR